MTLMVARLTNHGLLSKQGNRLVTGVVVGHIIETIFSYSLAAMSRLETPE
jgi:hypothetical protein